jgi:hypothetical protein
MGDEQTKLPSHTSSDAHSLLPDGHGAPAGNPATHASPLQNVPSAHGSMFTQGKLAKHEPVRPEHADPSGRRVLH